MLTRIDRLARRRAIGLGVALIGLLVAAGIVSATAHFRYEHQLRRLLLNDAAVVASDKELTRFAASVARPLYTTHCAACHGVDMKGKKTLGAPDLTDKVWLYGDGSVFDIERTLLYGIRSGLSKSRNEADMPPFGLTGRLSESDIRNLVQYLYQLSGRPHLAQAAIEGREVFADVAKANCADCHGADAQGNPDYGAPDLTANVWSGGDDERSLHDAIYFGRHRIMPAFLGTLSLVQIRAMAVYLHTVSRS
jgi:cytochrome c oxidase cbb3-type subunit III